MHGGAEWDDVPGPNANDDSALPPSAIRSLVLWRCTNAVDCVTAMLWSSPVLPRHSSPCWLAHPWQIQPARFAHICQCLQLGAAYCFDEAAYGVFLPLAQQVGLPLGEADFSDPGPTGLHFVRVQILPLG